MEAAEVEMEAVLAHQEQSLVDAETEESEGVVTADATVETAEEWFVDADQEEFAYVDLYGTL